MGCTAYLLSCLITYNVCSSMEISKIEKGRLEVPSNNDDNFIKCHRSIKYFLVMYLFFLAHRVHLVLHVCISMMQDYWNMGSLLGVTVLNKGNSPSFSGHQRLVAPQSRVEHYETFLCSCRDWLCPRKQLQSLSSCAQHSAIFGKFRSATSVYYLWSLQPSYTLLLR